MSAVKLPFLVPVLSKIISEKCATELANFIFSLVCFKVIISKILGYGIIAGSIAVKLPQVFKIIKSGSAEGISFIGQTLELVGVSSTVAYSISFSFPFSSYGEGVFLAVQTSLIAMLTIYYQRSKSLSFLFITLYGSLMGYLCSGFTPKFLLVKLMQLNIPIVAAGKLSQAWINYKNHSTGQLSVVSIGLIFAGSVARIFTTIQETGDITMVMTFVIAAVCNFILVLQFAIYWNQPKTRGIKNTNKSGTGDRKDQRHKRTTKPKKM